MVFYFDEKLVQYWFLDFGQKVNLLGDFISSQILTVRRLQVYYICD